MITQMTVVEVACPLCGESEGNPWGHEHGFTAIKCADCGLVYVSPRPDDFQISAATKVGQHRHEAEQISFIYERSARKIDRYRARIRDALGADLPSRPVSWLDIGAGFGEMVEALQGLLPARSNVIGIEPMGPKAEQARALGLPITSKEIKDIDERFDYVSLINVLSHLPQPTEFLQEVAALLKPTGTLVLVTGNGGDLASAHSYPDRLDLPDHLVFAGRDHVERFLNEAGLDLYRTLETRLDTITWSVKALIKKALGQPVPLVLPYRSPFRDMLYLARPRAQYS